ncbi:MAG: hypothetical protein HY263_05805 [Chloroflexi bacterium]|nr:hypothetical protein [Chloroflexota bacterium]
MSREIGDERQRYSRRSLRDRGIEVIDWLKGHPAAAAVLALFLGVAAIQIVAPARSALPADLQVGDCLYIRTPQSMDVGPGARPIGDQLAVESVLMGGGAEQAGCNTSHGHEVSGRVEVPAVPPVPPGVSVVPTVRAEANTACATAFSGYVGHALAGSIYETFAALPPTFDGTAEAICLVARRDGQWMTHPARASGE